jgi:hypothetical protein
VIGPYELQDFNLYYTLRFGYPPTKVAFLAYCCWHDREKGVWPDIPVARLHANAAQRAASHTSSIRPTAIWMCCRGRS